MELLLVARPMNPDGRAWRILDECCRRERSASRRSKAVHPADVFREPATLAEAVSRKWR
jgi:hypothetical protein